MQRENKRVLGGSVINTIAITITFGITIAIVIKS